MGELYASATLAWAMLALLALMTVSNCFDPQVPSILLQLQHDDDKQKNDLFNLIYFVSYKLLLILFVFYSNVQVYSKQSIRSFLLRVYLRMPQRVTRRQLTLCRLRVNLAKSKD